MDSDSHLRQIPVPVRSPPAKKLPNPTTSTPEPAQPEPSPTHPPQPARTVEMQQRLTNLPRGTLTRTASQIAFVKVEHIPALGAEDHRSHVVEPMMPSIALVWADGGYAGKLQVLAQHHCRILVEIVKRSDKRPRVRGPPQAVGFRADQLLADADQTPGPRPRTTFLSTPELWSSGPSPAS